MDAVFEKMKQMKKTDVESLIKWLKDSKVINTKAVEDKARDLLKHCASKGNIDLSKFKDALGKVAAFQKMNVGDLAKSLIAQGPKLLEGLRGGAGPSGGGMTRFNETHSDDEGEHSRHYHSASEVSHHSDTSHHSETSHHSDTSHHSETSHHSDTS